MTTAAAALAPERAADPLALAEPVELRSRDGIELFTHDTMVPQATAPSREVDNMHQPLRGGSSIAESDTEEPHTDERGVVTKQLAYARARENSLRAIALLTPFLLVALLDAALLAEVGINIPYPHLLAESTEVGKLYNPWLFLLFGCSPVLVVLYLYVAIFFHASVVLEADGRMLHLISFDCRGPLRHWLSFSQPVDVADRGSLFLAAKALAPVEVAAWVLYNVHAVLAAVGVIRLGYLEIGVLGWDLPTAFVQAGFVPFLVVLNFVIGLTARTFRAHAIRREASQATAFLRHWLQRLWVILTVSIFLLGYVLLLVSTAAPMTRALSQQQLRAANPCALVNHSYIARLCDRSPTCMLDLATTMVCADGGFAEYASAYTACEVARDSSSVVSKTYSAFAVAINAMVGLLAVPAILSANPESTALKTVGASIL